MKKVTTLFTHGCTFLSLLERAEEAGGNYTNAGDQYYFDGYISDPTKLLALRHEIAETLGALGKAIPTKAQ